MFKQLARPFSLVLIVIALFAAVLPASAGEGYDLDMTAEIVNCTVVVTFYMPEPFIDEEPVDLAATKLTDFARGINPTNTVFVTFFDDGELLQATEVTGPIGESNTVTYTINRLYVLEDIGIYVEDSPEGYTYDSIDPFFISDEVADACIQEQIAVLNCPYPPSPLLGQGRVIVPTLSYWAPRLDAETIPPVILPVGTSWWILEGRDGFYKLFIACQGRYVWVPAEALGANFDVVWNGRPLPSAGEPNN